MVGDMLDSSFNYNNINFSKSIIILCFLQRMLNAGFTELLALIDHLAIVDLTMHSGCPNTIPNIYFLTVPFNN